MMNISFMLENVSKKKKANSGKFTLGFVGEEISRNKY